MTQAVVQGDKIAAWATQQDLSNAQTLMFQLFQQQQAASGSAAAKPAVSASAKPSA